MRKKKSGRLTTGTGEKIIMAAYLLLFFVVAASMALYQPLADNLPYFANPPDEHARYLIPQFICKYGRLPTGFEREVRIPSYGFSYGFYNVFPYIVMGWVMRFVKLFTDSELILLYAARLINVFAGTGMAVMVRLLSRRWFSDHRFGWLFCFAVMFLPQSLFVHTYVNTDSFCLLSTAMILYGLVCAWQDGFGYRNSLWLSAGIILCALSYYNAYGFILSAILLFFASFYRGRRGKASYDYLGVLTWGSFISATVLLGISWWFLRSYILYDGDFLGLETRQLCAAMYGTGDVNPLSGSTYQARGYTVWEMLKESNFFDGAFIGFVAAFGSMSIKADIWLYRLYKVFLYGGLLGYMVTIWKYRKKSDFKTLFFHANMIFCAVMPLVLTIYYSYTMDYQNQGRYLMPMVIPLMYYVVKGLERLRGLLVKVPEKWITAAVGAGLGIIVAALLVMVYGYAFPIYMETGMVM